MEPRNLMLIRQMPQVISIMAEANNATAEAMLERVNLEVFMRNNGYKGQE
jgi:hypothetical protein